MNKTNLSFPPTAVDICSGGGALSVGLKRAGFKIIAGVEIETNAIATYKANHPEVHLLQKDLRLVTGDDIKNLTPDGKIGLLAGCPPCQGFTNLTLKHDRDDPRNDLVLEIARLAEELEPSVIMVENVPGLAGRGCSLLDEFIARIERIGYCPNIDILQVADYGVPQHRRRLVVLAGLGKSISMPLSTHSKNGSDDLAPWRTVRETIGDIDQPQVFSRGAEFSSFEISNWNIVRSISERNKQRLEYTKPGCSRTDIPDEIRPKCHKGKAHGFTNVYGRMEWDEVAPTITGGCTTLSMGRFGHPSENRTISVKEAALLQTFPEDYILQTPYIGYACRIIGNALPCKFAEAVAKECHKAITAD